MNIFIGITRNRLFMGIIGITVLLQVLIIEFVGKFAKTVRFNWKLWLVSVAIGLISWPLAYLGKFIPVPETPFHAFFVSGIHPGNPRTSCDNCPQVKNKYSHFIGLVLLDEQIYHQAVGVKCRSVVADTDMFFGTHLLVNAVCCCWEDRLSLPPRWATGKQPTGAV
ncbi:hypothetical protein MRB53_022242 [Persea americana]|uniref:Uncharacterized protein n=1 Tax=Persea americana TaxID=3435 RepID=A0ACC2L7A7_PERAE|nr:hypothetical protein MRB53_022242 [Persea americana]